MLSCWSLGEPSSWGKHTYLAQETPWSWRRFSQGEARHCTPAVLTPAINPNVVNSSAKFLIAGDCVRASPSLSVMMNALCGLHDEGSVRSPRSILYVYMLNASDSVYHSYGKVLRSPISIMVWWYGIGTMVLSLPSGGDAVYGRAGGQIWVPACTCWLYSCWIFDIGITYF